MDGHNQLLSSLIPHKGSCHFSREDTEDAEVGQVSMPTFVDCTAVCVSPS
jgi:hypothetical protein